MSLTDTIERLREQLSLACANLKIENRRAEEWRVRAEKAEEDQEAIQEECDREHDYHVRVHECLDAGERANDETLALAKRRMAERAALTIERDEALTVVEKMHDVTTVALYQCDALIVERDRYRAALEKIEQREDVMFSRVQDIARDALKSGG